MKQMNRLRARGMGALTLAIATVAFLIHQGKAPGLSVVSAQAQDAAIEQAKDTRAGAYSPPVPNPPLYPDPPQKPMLWKVADVRKVAEVRQAYARANRGKGSIGFSTGKDWSPDEFGMPPGQTAQTWSWPGQSFRTHSLSGLMMRWTYPEPKTSRNSGVLSRVDDADQHFNGADFMVVVAGGGTTTVGGEITNRSHLHGPGPNGTVALQPGEFNGQPVVGGKTFNLKPGDWVYTPPYAPHMWNPTENQGLVYAMFKLANEPVGVSPGGNIYLKGTAVRQDPSQAPLWRDRRPQNTLGRGGIPRFPQTPDQGFLWTLEEITKAHETLAAAEKAGKTVEPNSALHDMPFWTRRDSLFVMHVPRNQSGNTAAQHLGYAQIVVVMGGTGTVQAGGQLQGGVTLVEDGKQIWGETRGTSITGGDTFKLTPGDWVSIPADTPTQFKADAEGGLTYLVIKVIADIYPWQLVR